MDLIKERIFAKLPEIRERMNRIKRDYNDFKVCDVTVDQIYSGIRGVMVQVSDVSYVDPNEGIRLRGYTVPEALELLPKQPGSQLPMAGGLYFLLMVDEMPTYEEAAALEAEWRRHAGIPDYVLKVIRAMPSDTHPMTLFSQGILAMQRESIFAQEYARGLVKSDYWESYLEDAIRLTAKLPALAAFIYNHRYNGDSYIPPNPELDWSANFAHMIGKSADEDYKELCRLFFILHSDHEGANVSAHASWLVASALSDVYLASSAGMDGLAGPLHGLANQECLRWLLGVREHFGRIPSKEDLETYLADQLSAGAIIPGYGHAVLRITDPRFTAQLEFANKYLPGDELITLVKSVYEVLPPLLLKTGKVKNPWPNVDAINGALQYHFGVTQYEFYTVLFGVSRILGLSTHAVWARALNKPIERPKSLTTAILEKMIEGQSIP